MKTNKKQITSNFKGLDSSKKKSLSQEKKHHKHQNQQEQLNRSNKKGHNLHDLIKKVA